MKKCSLMYRLASLLLITVWGCQPTWWDVRPKDVYSPVDFSKPYRVAESKGYLTVEFSTNLKNRSEDTLGVYLYDDLASLQSQLNRKEEVIRKPIKEPRVSSVNNWVKAQLGDGTAKVTIEHSASTATTFYLLPILRTYTTDSTVRNYFSSNFLKVQLAPWSKLATLSLIGNKARFFTNETSLFYVNNDDTNLYFFKLDPTTNRFNPTGAISSVNISKFGDYNVKYIVSVSYGLYNQETQQYNLFINTSPRSSGTYSTIGKLILDSDFNIIDYKTWAWGGYTTLEFKKIHRQNDTLHVLYNYPQTVSPTKNPSFFTGLRDRLIRSAISLKTEDTLFSYNIDESDPTSTDPFVPSNKPTTIVFLGPDILLKYSDKSKFIYYGLNKPKQEIAFPTGITQTSSPFAVERGYTAYMSAEQHDSRLYTVKIDSQNNVVFEDLGLSDSRESTNLSYQAYGQGLLYQGMLTLLYQPGSGSAVASAPEVWQLNPARTAIDMQSPYTEVIPTNR